jgi:hypothetical protein
VFEDPPTEYQRWERWAGKWNIAAGEHIRYMTRRRALAVGLPLEDWWLLDSARVVRTKFDERGLPLDSEIVEDPATVTQHCARWDLAVRHSTPDQSDQGLTAA